MPSPRIAPSYCCGRPPAAPPRRSLRAASHELVKKTRTLRAPTNKSNLEKKMHVQRDEPNSDGGGSGGRRDASGGLRWSWWSVGCSRRSEVLRATGGGLARGWEQQPACWRIVGSGDRRAGRERAAAGEQRASDRRLVLARWLVRDPITQSVCSCNALLCPVWGDANFL